MPMATDERRIRELLKEGRWRKARDEIKPLLKAERVRFLPLLFEANVGLAREMIGKGLISEARQVVAYLKRILGQAQKPEPRRPQRPRRNSRIVAPL